MWITGAAVQQQVNGHLSEGGVSRIPGHCGCSTQEGCCDKSPEPRSHWWDCAEGESWETVHLWLLSALSLLFKHPTTTTPFCLTHRKVLLHRLTLPFSHFISGERGRWRGVLLLDKKQEEDSKCIPRLAASHTLYSPTSTLCMRSLFDHFQRLTVMCLTCTPLFVLCRRPVVTRPRVCRSPLLSTWLSMGRVTPRYRYLYTILLLFFSPQHLFTFLVIFCCVIYFLLMFKFIFPSNWMYAGIICLGVSVRRCYQYQCSYSVYF